VPLITGEVYHIYNRGVDKRDVFTDHTDLNRFYFSIRKFNTVDPIESLFRLAIPKNISSHSSQLVRIHAYCLLPNHFHLLLTQLVDGGISEYMKRLGGGYTSFFNERHERSGSLFQGTFKRVAIETNEQLLYVSAYINLNQTVHNLTTSRKLLSKSSLSAYENPKLTSEYFLDSTLILNQYRSPEEYRRVAEATVESIRNKRLVNKQLDKATLLE